MEKLGLSKSKYCKGVQCPKILWMDKYMPEVAEEQDNEAVFETGHKVGDLARSYFGEYALVDYNADKSVMVNDTKSLIESECNNIAEASFLYDGLFCAVDILHSTEDGYDIVEVKSSTEVKGIYLDDVAFQNYVLSNCGINVNRVYVMHIDNTYVRNGKLDLLGLFELEDVTDIANDKYAEVERKIKRIRAYVDTETEPVRDIDLNCDNPYHCPYFSYCSRALEGNTVFDIRRLKSEKKYEYYHSGIITFEDIVKSGIELSEKQMRQVETVYYNMPDSISVYDIEAFLDTLTYPVYHLDFETFQQAIPEFDGVKPYMQIPFQYSLHIEQENGALEHREFLGKEGTDPRRDLAESLCRDIPMNVCVLAYNMSFEKRVIRELAEMFPDLAGHLLTIHDNIRDLMVPFQKQYYYTKEMAGSYSIKYVLPALYPDDPELDYHSLEEIHHGGEASNAFATLAEQKPEDIARIRKNLLKYCGLDTYAMVKVLAKLKEVCQ
ncbi:MAG: DUF2779 domain-containing protein [Lachnospiraceae bacterium]|nr:DUF2779 domain-containing protein [Lachnospiraceae bacterium]